MALAFGWLAWTRSVPVRRGLLLVPAAAGVFAVAFALGQMACFGGSDYRRTADAIVVPGARAYANGTPSLALADRMRTACELFHEGHAGRLVVSGGPGDGAYHETDVMRRMALDAGVKISINTDAHAVAQFDQMPFGVVTARRCGATPDDVINTWPQPKLRKWIKAKRDRAGD